MPGQAIGYIILALILIAIAAWPVWREMRERQALHDAFWDMMNEESGNGDQV